jgi:erythromycin esterase-like protein
MTPEAPGIVPLTGAPRDYDALLAAIGESRFVLIGEASHGTHEFYRERAVITKRLITEKGFSAVAVEADWPDAWRVNRFVRALGDDEEPVEALDDFQRFPRWMWRNADVLDFIGWLRDFNDGVRTGQRKAGFYGIDLYSLFSSIELVIAYLQKVDPAAADRARRRYSCFDHFGDDSQSYGYATAFGIAQSCEDEVVAQLVDLQRKASTSDDAFHAAQNARLVANAERYYRSMFGGRVSSWNLRDTHMADTIDAVAQHFDAKVVVWAHNSHLGDARATEMGQGGEINVGQLMRERHGSEAFNIGFSTFNGTVTAATDWDAPAERKRVRDALPGSYEHLFHELGVPDFLVFPKGQRELEKERLQRAIGVIYRPDTERMSHYFSASLARQFDAMLHIDHTRAVEPLERRPVPGQHEMPETYPSTL